MKKRGETGNAGIIYSRVRSRYRRVSRPIVPIVHFPKVLSPKPNERCTRGVGKKKSPCQFEGRRAKKKTILRRKYVCYRARTSYSSRPGFTKSIARASRMLSNLVPTMSSLADRCRALVNRDFKKYPRCLFKVTYQRYNDYAHQNRIRKTHH